MSSRKVDQKTLDWVLHTRDRACLYGLMTGDPCQFGLSVHHIEKRSQLGDDVPENLITLCVRHHDMAEARLIVPEKFREILSSLYGYEEKSNATETISTRTAALPGVWQR